jgi:hypothetical protein
MCVGVYVHRLVSEATMSYLMVFYVLSVMELGWDVSETLAIGKVLKRLAFSWCWLGLVLKLLTFKSIYLSFEG